MRLTHLLMLFVFLGFTVGVTKADEFSYVGTLDTPESVFETTFTLSSTSTVVLQTYGFGGGTNQADTVIAPGGTAPLVGLFAGTGDEATMVTDAFANPFLTSVGLSNYGSFVGCPPAGTVSNFGDTTCADITMSVPDLAAGTYTVILTDGENVPFAFIDNGTLGEGYIDFTGGQFCNSVDADTNTPCPNTSGAYALDITTTANTTTPTPEPSSIALLALGLPGLAFRKRIKNSLA